MCDKKLNKSIEKLRNPKKWNWTLLILLIGLFYNQFITLNILLFLKTLN